MSYYHQEPNYNGYSYEYADYGNCGDEYAEYEPYLDYAELDHYKHEDGDTHHQSDADHQDVPGEFEHGHREPEYEAQELKELKRHDDRTGGNWEVEDEGGDKANKLGELKHEGNEETTHELEELEYTANEEAYQPEWLEYEGNKAHEPGYGTETHYVAHGPHRFKYDNECTHPHLYHYPTSPTPVTFDNTPTPSTCFPPTRYLAHTKGTGSRECVRGPQQQLSRAPHGLPCHLLRTWT
jgi:hypothetical protein